MHKITVLTIWAVIAAALSLPLTSSEAQDKAPERTTKAKATLPPGWSKLDLSAAQKAKALEIREATKAKIADLTLQIEELKINEKYGLQKLLTDPQRNQLLKSLGIGEPTKK